MSLLSNYMTFCCTVSPPPPLISDDSDSKPVICGRFILN